MPKAPSPRRNDRQKILSHDTGDASEYNTTGTMDSKSRRNGAQHLNNSQNQNPMNKTQANPSIFERLHEESKIKQQFKQQIEEIKILNELKDCTFKPIVTNAQIAQANMQNSVMRSEHNLSNNSREHDSQLPPSQSVQAPTSRDEIFERLAKQGTKQQKLQDYEKIKELYELSECTFKPQIKELKSLPKQVEGSNEPPTERGNPN